MAARCATPEQIADYERDLHKHLENLPRDQRLAVAGLVGICEGVVSSGILPPGKEARLREHIALVLAVFKMPSLAERGII